MTGPETRHATPPDAQPQPSLPHEEDREGGQPYGKEVDDYQRGVALPPEEQRGRDIKPRATPAPARK